MFLWLVVVASRLFIVPAGGDEIRRLSCKGECVKVNTSTVPIRSFINPTPERRGWALSFNESKTTETLDEDFDEP